MNVGVVCRFCLPNIHSSKLKLKCELCLFVFVVFLLLLFLNIESSALPDRLTVYTLLNID